MDDFLAMFPRTFVEYVPFLLLISSVLVILCVCRQRARGPLLPKHMPPVPPPSYTPTPSYTSVPYDNGLIKTVVLPFNEIPPGLSFRHL